MRAFVSRFGFVAAVSLASSQGLAQTSPQAGSELRSKEELAKPFDVVAAIAEGSAMTASRAAERAQEVSPSMERAEALSRASEAAVERARAQLFPRLEVSARIAHVDGFPDGKITPAVDPEAFAAAQALAEQVTDPAARALWLNSLEAQSKGNTLKIPRNQAGFAARLTWQVSDMFFAVYPTIDAAESSVRASRADEKARQARVRLIAREAFFQLARARGNLAVAARAVEQARAQQERIDVAVRAGMRAPSESASAAARVASSEQALATAETAVDVADASLRSMLQDADGPIYAISEPILGEPLAEPAALSVLLDKARAQRPEVLAMREAVEAKRRASKVDRAAGYPHLGVFVGGDYAMPNRYVVPPLAEFKPSWEVGATLSYAPNDTLNARRKLVENGAQIEALEAELGELLRALDLEVRRTRATLARSQRSVDAAQAAQNAAQAAYDQRMAQLTVGEVVLADLIASEQELNAARLHVLDAGIDQRLAQARLAYALGE